MSKHLSSPGERGPTPSQPLLPTVSPETAQDVSRSIFDPNFLLSSMKRIEQDNPHLDQAMKRALVKYARPNVRVLEAALFGYRYAYAALSQALPDDESLPVVSIDTIESIVNIAGSPEELETKTSNLLDGNNPHISEPLGALGRKLCEPDSSDSVGPDLIVDGVHFGARLVYFLLHRQAEADAMKRHLDWSS